MTPGRTRGQDGLLGSAGGAGPGRAGGGSAKAGSTRQGGPRSLRRTRGVTPGEHRCRGGNPRGPGSRTLTDGQRDEGHLDEERQPAQHIHEPHGAPTPPGPAPRQPGRACALRLGRYGAAATATASPPRRRPCAAAERSPARAPTPAASGLAPPIGAEGQLLPVRRACSRTARLLLETVSDAAWARQEGTAGRERGTSTRARKAVSGPSLCTPAPAWRGVQGRGGLHDPLPSNLGPEASRQVVHRAFSCYRR